jgi:CheY-like chemotaxis protein
MLEMTGISGECARTPVVLVVDDYADTRELYCDYLTELGYRVEAAAVGDEALATARALRPDVVVVNPALPLVERWSLIRGLRQERALDDALLIVLTAHIDEHDAEATLGIDALVTKPCLPRTLAETIARLVGRGDERRRTLRT